MKAGVILIVDDEHAARVGLRRALGRRGYQIHEASNGREALEAVERYGPAIMILDLNMPVLGGLEVLNSLEGRGASLATIVLTAHGNERVAVEAMKAGAYDYIKKPYDVEELRLAVKKALEHVGLQVENRRLREELAEVRRDGFGEMVGQSGAMRRVFDTIERVAELDVSVLISGESGTGKELVARAIHDRSERSGKPFVAINCAALPDSLIESELFGHERGAFTGAVSDRKGRFELAAGGTVLLDEVGDMDIEVQAKLLRTLESRVVEPLGGHQPREVDVRVLAATHKDLPEAIKDRRFRQDLYYRLKVVELRLPPLRERRSDIPLLVRHYLESFARKHKRDPVELSVEALAALTEFDWPGNVRELKNLVESLFVIVRDRPIERGDLPFEMTTPGRPGELEIPGALYDLPLADARKQVVQSFESGFIRRRLEESHGNISRAAQALGIHRQSLQQKLKELDINAAEYRDH